MILTRLRKNQIVKKEIFVISDLHLGAGHRIGDDMNPLEDFHHDQKLIEFFYYIEKKKHEKELIINGDFLDFLSVPYVEFFDDEFWSEKASIEKLKIIYDGHEKVFQSLAQLLESTKVTYVIGNHDGELILPGVQETLRSFFTNDQNKNFHLVIKDEYRPCNEVLISHGHQAERAHQFDLEQSLIKTTTDEYYFQPPWGSYYVTHLINRFKLERAHVNLVRPVKNFLIQGLIYDTFFTFRFMLAHIYYFFMVRFLQFVFQGRRFKSLVKIIMQDLKLFQSAQEMTSRYFEDVSDQSKVMIVGHTHEPFIEKCNFNDRVFINTGTWTKMIRFDYGISHQSGSHYQLPFALVRFYEEKNAEAKLSVIASLEDFSLSS